MLIYSAITLINAFAVSLFFFLIMEMPYKKLIKLYFNISSEINKVYLDNYTEDCNSMRMSDLNENDIEEDDKSDNIKDSIEE